MKSYGKNYIHRNNENYCKNTTIIKIEEKSIPPIGVTATEHYLWNEKQKINFQKCDNRVVIHNNAVTYRFEYCDYVIQLPYYPIKPQTLHITIDGCLGYMIDVSTENSDIIYLTNVNGYVGSGCINLDTGELTLDLGHKEGKIVRVNYTVDGV